MLTVGDQTYCNNFLIKTKCDNWMITKETGNLEKYNSNGDYSLLMRYYETGSEIREK